MKKIKCVILGYGLRGQAYAKYALLRPEELEIIAVIDFSSIGREKAKQDFNLPDSALFDSLDSFIEKGIDCDLIVNATMDTYHYETSVKILKAKYNMLLEKPVSSKSEEVKEIARLAKENNCAVFVCHVLRYTPFYSKIKEIIDSDEIGKVISIQANEHIWHGLFVDAFVRGKWSNEKECGSGLLLSKCCHDTDLLCWLNNATKPVEVSSFGSRSFYSPENAPKNATKYCFDCPAKDDCMFDAYKFQLKLNCIPNYVFGQMGKPVDSITDQEKIEYMKNHKAGECVFNMETDLVDRQSVSINFANGSIATLNMIGAATRAGRKMHVVCEYGELDGDLETNTIIYRKFNKHAVNEKYVSDERMYTQTILHPELDSKGDNPVDASHHGGDYFIMKDIVDLLNGKIKKSTKNAMTTIEDSIDGHFVVYAAEKSRKERKIVSLSEI